MKNLKQFHPQEHSFKLFEKPFCPWKKNFEKNEEKKIDEEKKVEEIKIEEKKVQEIKIEEKKVQHGFEKQLELLKSMGFINEVLNLHLLKSHNGNLEKIVPLLLKIK